MVQQASVAGHHGNTERKGVSGRLRLYTIIKKASQCPEWSLLTANHT